MGPSAAHLATAKNKKQRQFILRNYVPPAPPPVIPAPPPRMPVFTPPTLDQQLTSNIGQTESGVKSARKKRSKRTNLSKLKINLNPSASPFGNAGTGLNIGALT